MTVTQQIDHNCIDGVNRLGLVYFDGAAGKWHVAGLSQPVIFCPWCGARVEQAPVKVQA